MASPPSPAKPLRQWHNGPMMYRRVSILLQYRNVLSCTVLHSRETLPLAPHQTRFIFNSLSIYCTWRSCRKECCVLLLWHFPWCLSNFEVAKKVLLKTCTGKIMRWGYRNLLEVPLALSANWLSWVSEHAFAFVCMGKLKLVTRRFIYFFNAEYYLNVVSECDIEALLACWALKFKCNAWLQLNYELLQDLSMNKLLRNTLFKKSFFDI